MRVTTSRAVTSLAAAAVICLLAVDFAEARRGGRIGGGHRMMHGGPAASGAFHRSRARPRMNRPRPAPNRGISRDLGGTRSRAGPREPGLGAGLGEPGAYDPGPSRTAPRNPDASTSRTRPGEADTSLTRPQDPAAGTSVAVDQERADEIRDNRQDYYEDREDYYEDRQEYYEDREEYYEDRWRAGAYITVATWTSMNCGFSTVIIDAVTYYVCDDIRYERVYRGGEVIYIAVD